MTLKQRLIATSVAAGLILPAAQTFALNTNVETEATIATAIVVTQDAVVNGGLWQAGPDATQWVMDGTGAITIINGNYAYIAGASTGQITITGTADAVVQVLQDGNDIDDPTGNLRVNSLLGTGGIHTDADLQAGPSLTLDGTGTAVMTLGVNASWILTNTPEGTYTVQVPVIVNYQ